MREVAEIVVPWVFVTLALFALLDWDETLLSEEQLGRAWPPATRALALAYFGMVSLPVHFGRTRRPIPLGILLGAGCASGALLLDLGVSEAVDAAPETWLEALIWASLAVFTATMLWRARRGGFVRR